MLVDGWIETFDGYQPAGGEYPEDDGSYLQLRSRFEIRGDVDTEDFCRMMDIERAVGHLRETHPMSAAVLCLAMMGWTPAEINETCRKLRTPAASHFDRGIAYCRAYLSGDDAEKAFMSGKKRG